MTTITIMSRCHEYDGTWTPEREPLGKTLSDIGGMPPAFDFYTPPEPSAYDRIKACPQIRKRVVVYSQKVERDRAADDRKSGYVKPMQWTPEQARALKEWRQEFAQTQDRGGYRSTSLELFRQP